MGLDLFPSSSESPLFGGDIDLDLIKRGFFIDALKVLFEIDHTGKAWTDKKKCWEVVTSGFTKLAIINIVAVLLNSFSDGKAWGTVLDYLD